MCRTKLLRQGFHKFTNIDKRHTNRFYYKFALYKLSFINTCYKLPDIFAIFRNMR